MTMEQDTVIYSIRGNCITQVYSSPFFPNSTTTIAIPVQLSQHLNEVCYQLVELNKGALFQHILGVTFHEYFDIKSAQVKSLD